MYKTKTKTKTNNISTAGNKCYDESGRKLGYFICFQIYEHKKTNSA